MLTAFINAADDIQEYTALILNDFDLIEKPDIYEAMSFLIDHLPPKLHFVLATRSEPPLPLARYRARGELQELGIEELRFRSEEVHRLLTDKIDWALEPSAVATLQAQLEGWITGLRLAALAARRGLVDVGQVTVTGQQRFIADFLQNEVLADLPSEIRYFLLRTSILERLCGSVCEAITEVEDGQGTLEALEKEGLFLAPLDDRREWFRYHPLFADFLRKAFHHRHPDEFRDVHRRAALWFLAKDLAEPAFRHAVESNQVELVIEIADRYIIAKLLGGEIKVAQRWLDWLPANWYSTYPVLGVFQAVTMLVTGEFVACMSKLDEVEQRALLQQTDSLGNPGKSDRASLLHRVFPERSGTRAVIGR